MPDQNLQMAFIDDNAPAIAAWRRPTAARILLFCFPAGFAALVATMLHFGFRVDGQLSYSEVVLIWLVTLLAAWEAVPTANAVIGLGAVRKKTELGRAKPLSVAILVTIRDEDAHDVIPRNLVLLRMLQGASSHSFSLQILSDSSSPRHIGYEQGLVSRSCDLPATYHHREANTDFKSGNVRNWIEGQGADYDACIILDADSEIDRDTALMLCDELAADPACGLVQTVPRVKAGQTVWQSLQAVASQLYGGLQGQGMAKWMGDEANYFGHNAIFRTTAFATCAGLPRLKGRALWNGPILSHDFVEAALLRRAGWGVRLLPVAGDNFEQAPVDVIAHIKRDARWCYGNFQHARVLGAAGLHPVSRLHLLSGIFTYLSSAVWLATLVLWAMLDAARTGVSGMLAACTITLIAANLLMPRLLGAFDALRGNSGEFQTWRSLKNVLAETLFSSLIAPSFMLQRVMIMFGVFLSRGIVWAAHGNRVRGFTDVLFFHCGEIIIGLGLMALMERGTLTFWFLPLAACFLLAPVLSWFASFPMQQADGPPHTKS